MIDNLLECFYYKLKEVLELIPNFLSLTLLKLWVVELCNKGLCLQGASGFHD